jgi:CRP/FNR family transcriptional regulator, polysaccharide utilization system transcription regulator
MRKIPCDTCPARGPAAICNLPLDALEDFRAASTTAIYRPRQVVFSEGNPAAGLYLVCHGSVKLYHSDRFGREHILEVAGPGSVLGELPMDATQPMSVSAESLSDSQLCFLPRERLAQFLQRYPETGVRLIGALSKELAAARRKVRDLALKGAESRLADLLLQLARAGGTPSPGQRLRLGYTRREMADMIGVSTETAIRLLAKLRQKRIVNIDRRDIVIADVERLTQVANYDDALV